MPPHRHFRFAAALLSAAMAVAPLVSCGGQPNDARNDDGSIQIGASIPPLVWLAESIAPEGAEVALLVPAGASPHSYEPTPGAWAAFVRSDVWLLVGGGLDPARAPRRPVSMSVPLVLTLVDLDHQHEAAPSATQTRAHTHDHHHHEPHLWLDPSIMLAAAEALAARLATLPSADTDGLHARLESARAEIEAVDEAWRSAAPELHGVVLIATHDAWPRLAERYDLDIRLAIQPSEGVEPTPGAIRDAAQALREAGGGIVIVEPQQSRAAAERLAEQTGSVVVMMDPLGDGDWPAMMLGNLERLREGIGSLRASASVTP